MKSNYRICFMIPHKLSRSIHNKVEGEHNRKAAALTGIYINYTEVWLKADSVSTNLAVENIEQEEQNKLPYYWLELQHGILSSWHASQKLRSPFLSTNSQMPTSYWIPKELDFLWKGKNTMQICYRGGSPWPYATPSGITRKPSASISDSPVRKKLTCQDPEIGLLFNHAKK